MSIFIIIIMEYKITFLLSSLTIKKKYYHVNFMDYIYKIDIDNIIYKPIYTSTSVIYNVKNVFKKYKIRFVADT